MAATMTFMASKKKQTGDRHKPSRMIRVPEAIAAEIERIANEQMNTLTEQIKAALREYLVRLDRWPPQSSKSLPASPGATTPQKGGGSSSPKAPASSR